MVVGEGVEGLVLEMGDVEMSDFGILIDLKIFSYLREVCKW